MQDLAQHLATHAAPTPPVMPAAVIPAVAVPFPLDQPEHPLRVTEVSPDLADVHALPFLDSLRAYSSRTVFLVVCYAAPHEKFRLAAPLLAPAPGKEQVGHDGDHDDYDHHY